MIQAIKFRAQRMDQIIQQMVRAIVDAVDPEQVILLGSRASGGARKGSDVDLIVIESASFGKMRSRRLEAARLYEAVAGFPASADILVYSKGEADRWRGSRNHVLGRALREGKVLHARP